MTWRSRPLLFRPIAVLLSTRATGPRPGAGATNTVTITPLTAIRMATPRGCSWPARSGPTLVLSSPQSSVKEAPATRAAPAALLKVEGS